MIFLDFSYVIECYCYMDNGQLTQLNNHYMRRLRTIIVEYHRMKNGRMPGQHQYGNENLLMWYVGLMLICEVINTLARSLKKLHC